MIKEWAGDSLPFITIPTEIYISLKILDFKVKLGFDYPGL